MPNFFRPARRTEAKPLIGLYSQSGKGKTYSALILARGFVGPQGRIGVIETESGRGEAYADPNEYPDIGGYEVASMRDDFSPASFFQRLKDAEQEKLDALIIDSASHMWEGTGGVLDMAAQNQERNMKGVLVWQKPKIEHQRHFMLPILQTAIPLVILCMRAKYPMEQKTVDGKKEWVRSGELEPIQSADILFEMFVHGYIGEGHVFSPTKMTGRSIGSVFDPGKPISLETGRRLAAWAVGNFGTIDPEKELEKAKEIAAKGADAFRSWYTSRTKPQNEIIKPHMDALKAIAQKADKSAPAQDDADFLPIPERPV